MNTSTSDHSTPANGFVAPWPSPFPLPLNCLSAPLIESLTKGILGTSLERKLSTIMYDSITKYSL